MQGWARIVILAIALALGAAPSASALGTTGPTEFGNRCTGDAIAAGWTALGTANGEEPPFYSSAGPWELRGTKSAVITRWRVKVGPGLSPPPQQLVAFNYANEGEARNLGESAVETLVEGPNEFATRIPIPEYAHIGLRGPSGTLYCEGVPQGALGVVEGDFPAGSVRPYKSIFPKGVPVVAIAEPDGDGDGYGDATQDKCLFSALFHDPCPVVTMNSRVDAVRRGAILIGTTINKNAQIQVSGQISMPLGPKPKATAQGSRKEQLNRTVLLPSATQWVAAGVPTVFWIPLPKGVIRRLGKMKRNERLVAEVMVVASGALELEGRTMKRALKVRLPGRKRSSAEH